MIDNFSKPKSVTILCNNITKFFKMNSVNFFLSKIPVDAAQGRVNCALEMEDRSGIKPMLYVIAVNMDGTLKDVTKRYAGEHFDTQTRKSRTATESWFQETLGFFERKKKNSMDVAEEKYLESISSKAPMPTTVGKLIFFSFFS